MISKFLYAIEIGWERVKHNSKLAFIVVALFVFPILFVVVIEQVYEVARANIQTVEQDQIGMLHDAVSATLRYQDYTALSPLLNTMQNQIDTLTTFRIYVGEPGGLYRVIASGDSAEINSTSSIATILELSKVNENQTFTVPLHDASGRIEQAVRYVEMDNQALYIFSEHSRAQIDTVLAKRKQDAYLLLTLVFVFFIGLAYWVNRQADWERMYKKLHSTLEERDLFSHMIAHEFRTPLTAIKGYSSFLQESQAISPDERRYVDTIRDSAERLVLLVNDFLEIARIQSGKMKIKSTPIDLRSTIKTVIRSLDEQAAQKDLQLIYTQALQSQFLHTDENRITQILTNIISNSIKYTDSGTVEVTCEVDKRGVVVRVKDTGMGIAAEDQKKLFTPFARVGGVEKTSTTGTGLGMWITKQMVELLNGSISVESIKGVGTHVVLRFAHLHTED